MEVEWIKLHGIHTNCVGMYVFTFFRTQNANVVYVQDDI